MDEFVRAHQDIVIKTTLESLEKHGFGARFFSDRKEAAGYIMNIAADCSTVGIAGTHTVRALGVVSELPLKIGESELSEWFGFEDGDYDVGGCGELSIHN